MSVIALLALLISPSFSQSGSNLANQCNVSATHFQLLPSFYVPYRKLVREIEDLPCPNFAKNASWIHNDHEYPIYVPHQSLGRLQLKSRVSSHTRSLTPNDPLEITPSSALLKVHLKPRVAVAGERMRVLLFHGEHPRELISPQLALRLIKLFCQGHSLNSDVLARTEILIMPVINPQGLEKVEEGWYCQRNNLNDVDLNRNWPSLITTTSQSNISGSHPFGEWETRTLAFVLDKFKPHVFVSVHSGSNVIGTPLGASITTKEFQTAMKDRIGIMQKESRRIRPKRVATGQAKDLLKYDSPGNALDYIFFLTGSNSLFTLVFEIYAQSAAGVSLNQRTGTNLNHINGLLATNEKLMNPETTAFGDRWACFTAFNPVERSVYGSVLQTWSNTTSTLINDAMKMFKTVKLAMVLDS